MITSRDIATARALAEEAQATGSDMRELLAGIAAQQVLVLESLAKIEAAVVKKKRDD